ncbi:uncharacterized protein LOC122258475 [Penaeus japonicus]|uniref:uncharacterized protein LOC122258475 n=1 Tax=Penaeus japonicus TaxID=27405 RepID=UPI001C70FFCA|nr:uncharacterized protein LOC122258475 [Penaeus japonicus]
MAQYEERRIHARYPQDISPRVMLECQGQMTDFVVDTGCSFTIVTLNQVKKWGLEDKMMPSDLPGYLGDAPVSIKINGTIEEHDFYVDDIKDNLLGLDILKGYSAIIDMYNYRLTFRDYNEDYDISEPLVTINVDGKDIDMTIDTGSTFDMVGPMSVAKELGLHLEPSKSPICDGVGYTSTIEYEAYNLCMKGFGSEICGTYTVQAEDVPDYAKHLLLGARMCYGCMMQYNADGTFEIECMDQACEEAETAAVEEPQGGGETAELRQN